MQNVLPMFPVMTTAEYEAERQKIRATYGDSELEAANRWEQELAKLFARSGWTQEQLAKKEDKTQQWVGYQLRFGRFVEFTTVVVKSQLDINSLSEGRFRGFWERTRRIGENKMEDENRRFREVLDMMQEKTPSPIITIEQQQKLDAAPTVIKQEPIETKEIAPIKQEPKSIAQKIIQQFGNDDQWHSFEEIQSAINEPVKKVKDTLNNMVNRGDHKSECKSKPVGTTHHYLIETKGKKISVNDLRRELSPIIKELAAEGRKGMDIISPLTVVHLASRLKKLLDEWTK